MQHQHLHLSQHPLPDHAFANRACLCCRSSEHACPLATPSWHPSLEATTPACELTSPASCRRLRGWAPPARPHHPALPARRLQAACAGAQAAAPVPARAEVSRPLCLPAAAPAACLLPPVASQAMPPPCCISPRQPSSTVAAAAATAAVRLPCRCAAAARDGPLLQTDCKVPGLPHLHAWVQG